MYNIILHCALVERSEMEFIQSQGATVATVVKHCHQAYIVLQSDWSAHLSLCLQLPQNIQQLSEKSLSHMACSSASSSTWLKSSVKFFRRTQSSPQRIHLSQDFNSSCSICEKVLYHGYIDLVLMDEMARSNNYGVQLWHLCENLPWSTGLRMVWGIPIIGAWKAHACKLDIPKLDYLNTLPTMHKLISSHMHLL